MDTYDQPALYIYIHIRYISGSLCKVVWPFRHFISSSTLRKKQVAISVFSVVNQSDFHGAAMQVTLPKIYSSICPEMPSCFDQTTFH